MTKQLEHLLYESRNPLAESDIREVLDSSPKKEWVDKIEELNGYRYLPIDKVEWLLSRLFDDWSAEITHIISSEKKCIVGVSISYTIGTTKYKRPGVGSCDIGGQFTSSSTAFPAAKSIAIRDAAEMIGNIFGANLNRKNVPVPVKEKPEINEKVLEFAKGIPNCTDMSDLEIHFSSYKRYQNEPFYGQIKALYIKKKTELNTAW